jgi:hypothetical protein
VTRSAKSRSDDLDLDRDRHLDPDVDAWHGDLRERS